jgi:DNA invertase Pin-like site-specific DNA recombinase
VDTSTDTSTGLPDMRRVYSYVRFSTAKQARGDSLERQIIFRDRIVAKYGAVLDDTLTLRDLGTPAYRSQNALVGNLAAFLKAIKERRVSPGSILAIENLDRLTRAKMGKAIELFTSILNAGVVIATADPEREYTSESINDPGLILEAIITFIRAHEESKRKSGLVAQSWIRRKKRSRENGTALSGMAPAWLEVVGGRYRPAAGRAEVVKAIFALAIEGFGVHRITQILNGDPKKYPAFGTSGRWCESYVANILKNRAVFGEHRQIRVDPDTGKKLRGEPWPGLFPEVVSEKTFDRARAAIRGRRSKCGRPGKVIENLFTSLVWNVLGRTTMSLAKRTSIGRGGRPYQYVYLESRDVRRGARHRGEGPLGNAFRYRVFERAVLGVVTELKAAHVMDRPSEAGGREEAIRALRDDLIALDHKKRHYAEKAADRSTPHAAVPTYTALIDQAAAEEARLSAQLETLKAEANTSRPEALGESQSLIKLLDAARGEEATVLRLRLKEQLRLLLKEIWIVVEVVSRLRRVCHIQLHLKSGQARYVCVASPEPPADGRGPEVMDLSGRDFRTLDAQELINRGKQGTP